jgi:hypothetical protein
VGLQVSSSDSAESSNRNTTRTRLSAGDKAAVKATMDKLVSEGHSPSTAARQAAIELRERKALSREVIPEPIQDGKTPVIGPDETPARTESLCFNKDAGSSDPSALWKPPELPAKQDEQTLSVTGAEYSERSSVVVAFNFYFICKSGAKDNVCWTMSSSNGWTQDLANPFSDGQRWHCKVCGARYMTKFGVIIEVVQPHGASYMLADFPPSTLDDVSAMAMVREVVGGNTPAELFAAARHLVPASKLHLEEVGPGIYSITSQAELLACGTFQWEGMFTLRPTKKEQKAINNALWDLQKVAIAEVAEDNPDE